VTTSLKNLKSVNSSKHKYHTHIESILRVTFHRWKFS